MFRDVRYSGWDGQLCCRNACGFEEFDNTKFNKMYEFEWCMCQGCPICEKRCPQWILNFKSKFGPNGMWVGPHCISCDMKMHFHAFTQRRLLQPTYISMLQQLSLENENIENE